MAIYIGVALGLLIGGLVVCWLSPNVQQPTLVRVIWWLGLLLALCGALLFLAPFLAWLATNLRAALGV